MALTTSPNLPDPDGLYAALLAAHKGLSAEQSAALNARLILILMNHLGDPVAFQDAMALAKATG
jgi:hypothetical protein